MKQCWRPVMLLFIQSLVHLLIHCAAIPNCFWDFNMFNWPVSFYNSSSLITEAFHWLDNRSGVDMFARTFCRLCCTGYSIIIYVVFLCYLSSYVLFVMYLFIYLFLNVCSLHVLTEAPWAK